VPTYVDTHCHLDHNDELGAAEQVARANADGVTTLVTVGTDMASSTQAVQTATRFPGVWAVVGIHPNDAMEATPHVLEVIDRLAAQERVVGIGETGLDYYRDHTTPQQQDRAFRRHIEIAKRHDKTLVIHCRDAWEDCLEILTDEGAPDRVVMHCFSGDVDVVERCADAGWFMSFAGNVTFKNAQPLRDAAKAAPLDLLLTETDSPYLSPEPHRGKVNQPARVPHVLETLARLHDLSIDDAADAVLANAHRAFDITEGADVAEAV
jgi:TatD DNase family protein